MNKGELLDAIKAATDDNGRGDERARLRLATRKELYDKAKAQDLSGRSKMTKEELVDALLDD